MVEDGYQFIKGDHVSLTDEKTFKLQRAETEGASLAALWRRSFQAQGIPRTKALRLDCSRRAQEEQRKCSRSIGGKRIRVQLLNKATSSRMLCPLSGF